MHRIHRKQLSNGLEILSIPMPDASSVTVSVLVAAGTAYETESNNGISHFLEHMCFKGTPTRPRPIDIAAELEGIGASYNAFTSRDLTGYYAKVAPKQFSRAFNIIADMYCNPLFQAEEIEKEKGVIIEEINMYEDEPREKVSEALDKALYGNQHAGWSVAGTKDVVRGVNRDSFISYRNAHYVPGKTKIIVAGACDPKHVVAYAEKYFSNLPVGRIIPRHKITYTSKKPTVHCIEKSLDQTHFALGFHAVPQMHPLQYHVSLLAKVLGSGLSSRLFQKIREEMGAAYYIGAGNNFFVTHGYTRFAGGVNHEKLPAVIDAVVDEISIIRNELVGDAELRRVKDFTTGRFMLSLDSSDDVAFYYGEQLVSKGEMHTPAEVVKKIQAVTPQQIRAAARKFFTPENAHLVFIGPHKKSLEAQFVKKLQKIR